MRQKTDISEVAGSLGERVLVKQSQLSMTADPHVQQSKLVSPGGNPASLVASAYLQQLGCLIRMWESSETEKGRALWNPASLVKRP